MTTAYSNIADSVVEQLSGEGWTTGDIERLNEQAAVRGTTVSFVCQSANPCRPAEQQARQDRLEQAYLDSGRSNGLYTGLLTVVDDNQSEEIAAASQLIARS